MLKRGTAARRLPPLSARPLVESGSSAAISVRPLPAAARFSLRLDPAAAQALGTIAGFALDVPINRCAASGGLVPARLGPNEWLLLAPEADDKAIAAKIDAALAGRFYALVDVGQGAAAFEVLGRHAADVLNSGCPLDLAPKSFPAGSATRTLLGKAEIILMRLDDAPVYRVECGRSYARYVHEFLREAAREFEVPPDC
jgi:sarcosine oxidase, subunit gamma